MREGVIYPGEDGQWVAECPSLPGCVTQGHTREEEWAASLSSKHDDIGVYPRRTVAKKSSLAILRTDVLATFRTAPIDCCADQLLSRQYQYSALEYAVR